MPGIVMRDIMLEVGNEFRLSGRGPKRLIPPLQHVPELWHFIDIPLPHEGPHTQSARIIQSAPLRTFSRSIQFYGSDLDDAEWHPVHSPAALALEDWATRFQPDRQAKIGNKWRADLKSDDRPDDVKSSLGYHIERRVQRLAIHAENRCACDGFE